MKSILDLTSIETNQILSFENIACFRKELKQSDLQDELGKFLHYLKQHNYSPKGPLINVTYKNNMENQKMIMDTEYLLPIDKGIDESGPYLFKARFHLVNAIKLRVHNPTPKRIEQAYENINRFIVQKNLHQITYFYSVSNLEHENDTQDLYIYVGINPSIL